MGMKKIRSKKMNVSDDNVFKALADASRRKILDHLHKKRGQTLNELCENHQMTRQAVSKHLLILEKANLVVTRKEGRHKLHYLNPIPVQEIYTRWIGKFEQSRLQALDNLKRALTNPAQKRGAKRENQHEK